MPYIILLALLFTPLATHSAEKLPSTHEVDTKQLKDKEAETKRKSHPGYVQRKTWLDRFMPLSEKYCIENRPIAPEKRETAYSNVLNKLISLIKHLWYKLIKFLQGNRLCFHF